MISVEFNSTVRANALKKIFGEFPESFDYKSSFSPKVDIVEGENEYLFYAELPGVKKEDVKVLFENNFLSISGKRVQDNYSNGETELIRQEISYGEFNRRFEIDDDINPDTITAKFENGLLIIKVQKAEAVKPKEIKIEEK
jgi:HSP20 family protein